MQNGHDKQPAPIQVNPQQAAAYAMQFIVEVPHTRQQRDAYDMAVALLTAIVNGQVLVVAPPNTGEPAQVPRADER